MDHLPADAYGLLGAGAAEPLLPQPLGQRPRVGGDRHAEEGRGELGELGELAELGGAGWGEGGAYGDVKRLETFQMHTLAQRRHEFKESLVRAVKKGFR